MITFKEYTTCVRDVFKNDKKNGLLFYCLRHVKESLPKCEKDVPGWRQRYFYKLLIVARRVTIFVALFYSKEIAETCAIDAVALKVYGLKSKCLFYEYLTSLFEKKYYLVAARQSSMSL